MSTQSTLLDDLNLSASDEEGDKDFLKSYANEDDLLLQDDDDDKISSNVGTNGVNTCTFYAAASGVSPSTGTSQCFNGTGNPIASTSASVIRTATVKRGKGRNTGEKDEPEDGQIDYETLQGDSMSAASAARNCRNVAIMDLDEVCRERNILPPPNAPRRQDRSRFQHERPITGAWNAFYKRTDPRKNMSLDDIIRMGPSPSFSQNFKNTSRRQQNAEGNYHTGNQRNEKLVKGLETFIQGHPQHQGIFNGAVPTAQEQEQEANNRNEVTEWAPDSWHSISILINKGYNILWSVMKIRNCEYFLTEEEKTHAFRCEIIHNKKVQGICEAETSNLAKQGAAADFLGKLVKALPLVGKLTTEVNEAILLDHSLPKLLTDKLIEKYGAGAQSLHHFYFQKERVNNRTLYKCTLFMRSSKFYEAYSYMNKGAAKLMASKLAYEDLLKEPCPMKKIHIGFEQCTMDQSRYRVEESNMVHCYDFSRATIIDQKTVQQTAAVSNKKMSKGNPFERRGKAVQVYFAKPL